MKILYLSPASGWGGAEKVLWSVMTGVRRARPDVDVHLLALSPGPLVERTLEAGIETTVEPLPATMASLGDSQLNGTTSRWRTAWAIGTRTLGSSMTAWRYVRRLKAVIRSIQPDLIHSNGIKTHCLAWLAAPREVPVIWHVHDFFSSRPLARRLLRLASRRLNCAIAISRAVADDLKTSGLTVPTVMVPNAIDVDEFSPASGDGEMLDRLAGLAPAATACVRIGLVATYARWKGHEVFLEAAAKLVHAALETPVCFYVIGGPIYQTSGSQYDRIQLQERARQLGIGDRVGFIDFQPDVVPLYRALDIVVHASTAPEPFGLTIIEAMACGKPVVATYAGGVVDIIQPGYDAVGVPCGDTGALAAALGVLIADPELRRRLGANARETVCARFAAQGLGARILAVYEPFLDRIRLPREPRRSPSPISLGELS